MSPTPDKLTALSVPAVELVDWQHIVLLLTIFSCCLLLWRLRSQKLAGVYFCLTVYLVGDALQSIIVFPLNPRAVLYGWIYVVSTPILWIFAYLVVLELYRLIFQEYPGIAAAGRKAVTGCMVLGVTVSAIYAVPDLRSPIGPYPVLRAYAVTERSVALALLLFLVLIQLFLFHYKLRLSQNRMFYANGYALYFGLSIAEDILYTALGVRVPKGVSLWIVAAGDVILLAGAALLNREGETPVELQPEADDSDRLRLHRRLAEMNGLLNRAARGRGAADNN